MAELEQEHDTKPFFEAVRKFYVKSIQKMIQKFPFGDRLFRDLEILVPGKFDVQTATKLAQQFPQLGISSLDTLREECLDYTLSPTDLPDLTMYKVDDHTEKPCIGEYWWNVGQDCNT